MSSAEAINVLKDCGFKIVRNGKALCRCLEIPLDERNKHYKDPGRLNSLDDYTESLEILIDYWIANLPCSWDKLIDCVKKIDPPVADNIKAKVYGKYTDLLNFLLYCIKMELQYTTCHVLYLLYLR